MNTAEFEKLLKPDVYQVFLFSCPAAIPVSFARHPWFVVHHQGVVERYEVLWQTETFFRKKGAAVIHGHMHKNLFPPADGIPIIPFFFDTFRWHSHLHSSIEGDGGKHCCTYVRIN